LIRVAESAARIRQTNCSGDGVKPGLKKDFLIQMPAQGKSGATEERASATGGRRTGFNGINEGG
jgi:hypothetical protein